jgi:flavin-dependent dehydrogenase
MRVNNLTIVGGGSSGWMAAAALAKLCPQIEVTLVESPDVKTVGVGESTLGQITYFLDMLGLKDKDWMHHCNATYKNSIRFTNFRENDGSSFQYPFSNGLDYTEILGGVNTWSEMSTLWPEEFTPDTFAKFYATAPTYIADMNKQTYNADNSLRFYDFKWDTAYHVDAAMFGEYLKEYIALPGGVKHIKANVIGHTTDDEGYIATIELDNGETLTSDLWVDCTGFKSMLLEEWMGSKFKSFDTHLFNDSAWAARIPYENREEEMHNYTDCHALGNGWVWNIPLWSRIGTGYVYSSKFTTKEEAKQEFIEHLKTTGSAERAENAEMYHIDMRHGRRERGWIKNVVGVGLSYGFVEPLESTGLLTTHENIIKLIEVLNRRKGFVTRTEKEGFNFAVENEVLKFRDFVSTHYSLSMRDDTPYWKYCTEQHDYCSDFFEEWQPKNQQYNNLIGNITLNRTYPDNTFVAALYLAAGMGIKPISTKAIVENSSSVFGQSTKIAELEVNKERYYKYRDHVIQQVSKLPSHYEFLKNEIYGGKDEYM